MNLSNLVVRKLRVLFEEVAEEVNGMDLDEETAAAAPIALFEAEQHLIRAWFRLVEEGRDSEPV